MNEPEHPPPPERAPCGAEWAEFEEVHVMTIPHDGTPGTKEKVLRKHSGGLGFSSSSVTYQGGKSEVIDPGGWRYSRTCIDGHHHSLLLRDGDFVVER